MAIACGSIWEADSTPIGRSGVPPGSRRASRSRSSASFCAVLVASLRRLRAVGLRFATRSDLAGGVGFDAPIGNHRFRLGNAAA